MSVRSLLSAVNRKMLSSVYRRPVSLRNSGPTVTFGFDDFPRTAYLVGGPILESFGARGTYYIAPGLMHTSGELGDICNEEDVRDLLEHGHELGTQTFHHPSSRAVSAQVFCDDVEKGIQHAERIARRKTRNFAYPYGHVTLGTKKNLTPIVSSSRSVFPGINGPEIDLNMLRANRLYGDMAGCAYVQDLIRENEREKGWLIFYTHDVRPSPSVYGCTPELFGFAVAAAAKSSSRILTVEQVLSELKVGRGQSHVGEWALDAG